jgi:flagellar motility protein MotE (MotC chaperone)
MLPHKNNASAKSANKKPVMLKKNNPFLPARMGLFAIIFCAVLVMGLRVQEMLQTVRGEKTMAAVQVAKAETAPSASEHTSKPAEEKKPAADAPVIPEAAPVEEPENFSEAEVNILKKLSERRGELEKRARDLDQREALMRLTEQRVDKKVTDLKAIQDEIKKVVGDFNQEQKARAESLVKIYETMKPKDAARIFEALDVPMLVSVVSQMKDARVAPILALMDAQKAKALTNALMEKKPLPVIPQ